MSIAHKFTIATLLYGDYLELAYRCLEPLRRLEDGADLRIGANEVGTETGDYLDTLSRQFPRQIRSPDNLCKYPMMRRLLTAHPLAEYVMWFDDDSYITCTSLNNWLEHVDGVMGDAHMIGGIYQMPLQGNQDKWIAAQPWYTGKPVRKPHTVKFVTGGWWCIRSEVLMKHDWPDRQLLHRGGDVMLGELCRQQGYRLVNFRKDVKINADALGRESKAKRRGFDSSPIGATYAGEHEQALPRQTGR